MINREPTPPGAVLVAIDHSKSRDDRGADGPRRRRLIVLNTRTERDRFVASLEVLRTRSPPLAFCLLKAGIVLRLISSVALARTREALHNGWDKNDLILHMLRIGATQTYVDPLVVKCPMTY